MIKCFLALSLCWLPLVVKAQNSDSIPLKKFNLGISILDDPALFMWQINGMTTSLQIEAYQGDKSSVSFSLGYVTCLKPTPDVHPFGISAVESANGFRYHLEYREYVNRTKRFTPAYIILPHMLQFRSVTAPNTGYYGAFNWVIQYLVVNRRQSVPNEPLVPEVYQVQRVAVGATLKAGYMCQYKCGFIFDLNVGFGVQFIMSDYRNRFIDPFSPQAQEREGSANKLFDNGIKTEGYISSNLKIGWAF